VGPPTVLSSEQHSFSAPYTKTQPASPPYYWLLVDLEQTMEPVRPRSKVEFMMIIDTPFPEQWRKFPAIFIDVDKLESPTVGDWFVPSELLRDRTAPSLRSLDTWGVSPVNVIDLPKLLEHALNLERLGLRGRYWSGKLDPLPPHVVPGLKTLAAKPRTVASIVPGRLVTCVMLYPFVVDDVVAIGAMRASTSTIDCAVGISPRNLAFLKSKNFLVLRELSIYYIPVGQFDLTDAVVSSPRSQHPPRCST
jgi:hypothetical protein